VPNPYLQVLRTPHALPMVLAAFIGRLPLSMVGLGSVLLIASNDLHGVSNPGPGTATYYVLKWWPAGMLEGQ